MNSSQIVNEVTPMMEATAKTGVRMPPRWSWPPARRTRIQNWSRRTTSASPPMSVSSIPTNEHTSPRLTESAAVLICAPIQSHANGIGPQNEATTSTITSRMPRARALSMWRRRSPARSGWSR
jgi:hypothetical protein